jgi:hypothetical protein
MTRVPQNMSASVRQRLLNLSRERGEEFQNVLTRFALERLVYRLSCSSLWDQFILKGAMLFTLWSETPHRATWDLDFLSRGNSDVGHLEQVFRGLCRLSVEDDGLSFLTETVRGEQVRQDQEYRGVRIYLEAELAGARIPLRVDLGFGDAVTPRAEEADYPTLLPLPAPRVKVYPRETVVSEKLQAMVLLGMANSRMKDFYDLQLLADSFAFEGLALCAAIRATFERRRTPVPETIPLGLTTRFSTDPSKQAQWQAFVRRGRLGTNDLTLDKVCGYLQTFLVPPVQAVAQADSFDCHWPPGGPWQLSARAIELSPVHSPAPEPRDPPAR